jgi:excinuclease ABC subunit A
MQQGDGLIMLLDKESGEVRHYSKRLMCPITGLAYKEPAPHNFSFNSPQGACPKCKGLGHVTQLDIDKLIPDKTLSIYKGAIVPLGNYKNTLIFRQIEALIARYDYTLKTPVEEMEANVIEEIFYGCTERIKVKTTILEESDMFLSYDGLVKYFLSDHDAEPTAAQQKWIEQFSATTVCPECHGARINKEALHYRILDKNIYELSSMDISELYEWLEGVEPHLESKQQKIAAEILKELRRSEISGIFSRIHLPFTRTQAYIIGRAAFLEPEIST